MREAVIVSTARTPIGKAYRGGFNNLAGATLGAVAVTAAVEIKQLQLIITEQTLILLVG